MVKETFKSVREKAKKEAYDFIRWAVTQKDFTPWMERYAQNNRTIERCREFRGKGKPCHNNDCENKTFCQDNIKWYRRGYKKSSKSLYSTSKK